MIDCELVAIGGTGHASDYHDKCYEKIDALIFFGFLSKAGLKLLDYQVPHHQFSIS